MSSRRCSQPAASHVLRSRTGGHWQENCPPKSHQSNLLKVFHPSIHRPLRLLLPALATCAFLYMHLGYYSTALSALRNHFREAGDGNADLKGTIRTLRQWGIRRVLQASRSAWRYLSRHIIVNASTWVIFARVKFVLPKPLVANQKLHVAHGV